MFFQRLLLVTSLLIQPILLTTSFLVIYASTRPDDMAALPSGPYPGDDVIPDAVMVYDHVRLIDAPRAAVWPWVMQVGKGRGGWYTPASFERVLPKSWHATRSINPEWQKLQAGDRVDDYGFSADDHFIVSDVQPERALIYRSDRYGAHFSWSLILHEVPADPTPKTLLHLRFRGKIAATGIKQRVLVTGGGILDQITTAPMLAGLAERAEHGKSS